MGKELKRYYLTSYRGTKTTTVCTNYEYEKLLVNINILMDIKLIF